VTKARLPWSGVPCAPSDTGWAAQPREFLHRGLVPRQFHETRNGHLAACRGVPFLFVRQNVACVWHETSQGTRTFVSHTAIDLHLLAKRTTGFEPATLTLASTCAGPFLDFRELQESVFRSSQRLWTTPDVSVRAIDAR
jgi:hypothetical protein